MKKLLPLLSAGVLATTTACHNTSHHVDRFDNVRVEQMEANNVSGKWFEKTVVCLNARREVRPDGGADHFLLVEHTPTPEFTLATGESLALLVDGTRHTFTATNSPSAIVHRPGYTTLVYRATPQLFVELANARQVELRLKGTTLVIERQLTRASIAGFRAYLMKYFQSPAAPPDQPAATQQTKRN